MVQGESCPPVCQDGRCGGGAPGACCLAAKWPFLLADANGLVPTGMEPFPVSS